MKDRLAAVGTVYHQPFGEGPTSIEFRFSRELEAKEQLYSRHIKVSEAWELLDCGWIKSAGMLVITNDEGKHQQVKPTAGELEAISKRIVEVAYGRSGKHGWLIPPGESMIGCPSNVQGLYIRCHSNTARCTVHLIPQ